MSYLASNRYGLEWQGAIVVGSLKFGEVRWLQTVCDRVLHEAVLPIGARVRDVRMGPDGLIYLLTDEENGKLLRLRPKEGEARLLTPPTPRSPQAEPEQARSIPPRR